MLKKSPALYNPFVRICQSSKRCMLALLSLADEMTQPQGDKLDNPVMGNPGAANPAPAKVEPKKLNPALIICIWIALSSSVVSPARECLLSLPACTSLACSTVHLPPPERGSASLLTLALSAATWFCYSPRFCTTRRFSYVHTLIQLLCRWRRARSFPSLMIARTFHSSTSGWHALDMLLNQRNPYGRAPPARRLITRRTKMFSTSNCGFKQIAVCECLAAIAGSHSSEAGAPLADSLSYLSLEQPNLPHDVASYLCDHRHAHHAPHDPSARRSLLGPDDLGQVVPQHRPNRRPLLGLPYLLKHGLLDA